MPEMLVPNKYDEFIVLWRLYNKPHNQENVLREIRKYSEKYNYNISSLYNELEQFSKENTANGQPRYI